MQGYSDDKITDLSSTGIELYTDWNFLSIMINVNLGVRASYLISDDNWHYEFLIGFSTN